MLVAQDSNIPDKAQIFIHATDTCYGFATRFNDAKGLKSLEQIKGRPPQKPFSLLFANIEMLKDFCEINEKQLDFINSINSPASFILKKKDILKNYFPDFETVSVRIENDNFPVRLSSLLNNPITSTSVNKSGEEPLYASDDIKSIFNDLDDNVVLIDSGEISKTPPSQIYDLTKERFPKIR